MSRHNGKSRTPEFDKRKYPLRKVVERDVFIRMEGSMSIYGNKLECGHVIRPARDFYGEIHSDSQRCKLCHQEKMRTEK